MHVSDMLPLVFIFTRNNCSLASIVGFYCQKIHSASTAWIATRVFTIYPLGRPRSHSQYRKRLGRNAWLPRQHVRFVVSHCGRHCDQTKCGRILGFGVLCSYLPWTFCPFNFSIFQHVYGNKLQIRSRATWSEKSKKSSEKARREDKGVWKLN